MQPEPVIAGLIATHHTRRRAELLGRPPADPFDQRQQFGVISPCDPMAGNPVPIRAVQRHQPALLTQFDCNENCATMAGGGRVCGRCLHLTLRWFECGNPNLPERPRSPPHGIYGLFHSRPGDDASRHLLPKSGITPRATPRLDIKHTLSAPLVAVVEPTLGWGRLCPGPAA